MRAVLDFLTFRPTLWILGVATGRATTLVLDDNWGDIALWTGFGILIAWLLYEMDRQRAKAQ
jgi:hypothetical protein